MNRNINSDHDPVFTDGDKYTIILENEKVRVLEYRDKPGESTKRHYHPDFVLYVLDSFKRRLTLDGGMQIEREFKKGDAMWMNAQFHIGENTGSTDTHVIIIEIKQCNNSITPQAIPYDDMWKEI
jgi:quercetin dioxygenase-like cupin family protein